MFEYRHNKCVGPHSPAGQNFQQNYGNKKRRGTKFLRAYPNTQALALPLDKDKQRKACPRRAISHTTT